ncbi:hypothetical protein HOY80DRAFT_1098990 [Tuber brumale]|nr:hypothetical protein HOY80DRAFT_1098990 [Tuber brumale]
MKQNTPRKYRRYEDIIPKFCESLDELDKPNTSGSLIWVGRKYGEKINNPDELPQAFMEGFQEGYTLIQLQLLTADVKLLKKPESQILIQQTLRIATSECEDSDI